MTTEETKCNCQTREDIACLQDEARTALLEELIEEVEKDIDDITRIEVLDLLKSKLNK